MTKPYPVYAYSAYARSFRIEQPNPAYRVTVHDYKTGALLAESSADTEVEAMCLVHGYENDARATGAKR